MQVERSSEGRHEAGSPSGPSALLRVTRLFAPHDALMTAYLVAMTTLLLLSEPHPDKLSSLRATGLTLAVFVSMVALYRSDNACPRPLASHLYRATIASTVIINYVNLQHLLPVVRHDVVDDALARIDLALLGEHPSIVLEPYSTPAVVEFLAFFYFGYFFICIGLVVVSLWFARRTVLTTEYAIGTALVYGIGQLGYTAVPGVGPIHFLKDAFHGPLVGGFFWQLVLDTVNASGAHKDVFPSLHTAAPVFYAFHTMRRARLDAAWRWPSRVIAFSASCIVVSTVVLRWHYVIDVVAGLALAAFAYFASIRLAAAGEVWRARVGAPPVWDPEVPAPTLDRAAA